MIVELRRYIGLQHGLKKGNQQINSQISDYKFKLQSIAGRLKDLMIIFKNKWFYKLEMKGSSSIKDVLTALDQTFHTKN